MKAIAEFTFQAQNIKKDVRNDRLLTVKTKFQIMEINSMKIIKAG
jgi:hypothetical protein